MRNLKRALSLALAAIMLIGMMALGTSAASVSDFSDGAQIEHVEAASVIAGLGIMTGRDDGSFDPDATITRAEMTVVIGRLLQGPSANPENYKGLEIFSDVNGHWAAGWINMAYAGNIVSGVGDDRFAPDTTLNVGEATTMILKALGVSYDESNWPLGVMSKAIEIKLFGDVPATASAPMTRDMVAALTFNGLIYSPTGGTTYYVTSNGGAKGDLYTGDDYEIAKLVLAVNSGSGATIATEHSLEGSLGKTVFGLDSSTKMDAFGREIDTWVVNKDTADERELYVSSTYTNTANIVIANRVEDGNSSIENVTLKGLSVKNSATTGVTPLVDNKDADAAVKTLAQVAALCADNNVVEIYLDSTGKTIESIIVVNTFAGKITVKEANAKTETERSINIAGATGSNALVDYETEDFQKDDIVLYTRSWNEDESKYEIVTVEAAPSVVGTIISYTSANVFKIDGVDYSKAATTLEGLNDAGLKALIGTECVFYLNSGNRIIAASEVDDAVVSKDFLYVMAVEVDKVAGEFGASSSITARLQVVLPTGEVAVYSMPIKDTVASTDHTYSYKLNGEDHNIDSAGAEKEASDIKTILNTTSGEGLIGSVFTYTVKDSTVTLVTKLGALTSGTEDGKTAVNGTDPSANITKTSVVSTLSTSDLKVILNSKTVFVLIKDAKNIKAVTGVAALEDTSITAANATMVIAKSGTNNVAQVVFAKSTTFSGAGATTADDYVYVDHTDYSVSKDSDDNDVYTYAAVMADGSVIELTSDSLVAASGVYKYNSNDEIVDDSGSPFSSKETLGLVTDEIVQPDEDTENYYTRDDSKIVFIDEDAELEAGAQAWTVVDSGEIVVMFVTDAAPDTPPVPKTNAATIGNISYSSGSTIQAAGTSNPTPITATITITLADAGIIDSNLSQKVTVTSANAKVTATLGGSITEAGGTRTVDVTLTSTSETEIDGGVVITINVTAVTTDDYQDVSTTKTVQVGDKQS